MSEEKIKIAIAVTGYVGLFNAMFLAKIMKSLPLILLPRKLYLPHAKKSSRADSEIEEVCKTDRLILAQLWINKVL